MRPQLARFIAGKKRRARRTPLSTLTSKNLTQSSSAISSNGFGSKMPRLLTSISTPGCCRVISSAEAALLRSPANLARNRRSSIEALSQPHRRMPVGRPLTITRAPSRARVVAIARPMPAVLPLISARLPFNSRSMGLPFNFERRADVYVGRVQAAAELRIAKDVASGSQSAVDHHRHTGYPFRFVAGQEQRHIGDVLR
jgi:hypothetical protein